MKRPIQVSNVGDTELKGSTLGECTHSIHAQCRIVRMIKKIIVKTNSNFFSESNVLVYCNKKDEFNKEK